MLVGVPSWGAQTISRCSTQHHRSHARVCSSAAVKAPKQTTAGSTVNGRRVASAARVLVKVPEQRPATRPRCQGADEGSATSVAHRDPEYAPVSTPETE